jgi:hypothetical protein
MSHIGMNKYNIKVGSVFGKYTVIAKNTIPEKNRDYTWLCRCECGAENYIRSWALGKGKRTRCHQCALNDRLFPNDLSHKKRIYDSYLRGIKKRKNFNREFSLTFEEFCKLIVQNCFYCGSGLLGRHMQKKRIFKYNGIDRKDNTKGYTKENTVSCCKICNRGKNVIPYEEWIQWLDNVAEYRQKIKPLQEPK